MALIHHIDHPVVDGIRLGRTNKKGGYHLTSSCIIYQIGSTIIDTGPSREWPAVREYFDNQHVREVLLTHYHEDHSGNGYHFQQHYDAPIYSHPNNHCQLSEGLQLPILRKLLFGSVKAFQPKPLPNSIDLESGHQLQTFHLPGHTNDLCCFHEANEGWLFTGDLYVANRIKYLTREEDINDWISSLKQVLTLDFETLFCSHRAVVTNGKAELAKKLDFILSLREEVKQLYQAGYPTKQISRKLLGREEAPAYLSYMFISKHNLVKACLASITD